MLCRAGALPAVFDFDSELGVTTLPSGGLENPISTSSAKAAGEGARPAPPVCPPARGHLYFYFALNEIQDIR